jgi:hypothetical protein
MSAQLREISAATWKQEHYAAELKAERQADRPARRQAANFAAAFDVLFHVSGFIPDARLPLHIFLSQTRGCAPDEEVIISETEAGRLLPGDDEVAPESMRKRWVRAWKLLESEMARTGKSVGSRINGSVTLATRYTRGQKKAPVYRSEIAQAVVDIERAARRMNGLKRAERFRLAALEVWSHLPDYHSPAEKQQIKTQPEGSAERIAGKQARRMRHWQKTAKEMIAEAQAQGPEALDTLRARLHAELETLFADAESVTESEAPLLESDLQIPSENCEIAPAHVDRSVHENSLDDQSLPEPSARELELYLSGLPDELAELVSMKMESGGLGYYQALRLARDELEERERVLSSRSRGDGR